MQNRVLYAATHRSPSNYPSDLFELIEPSASIQTKALQKKKQVEFNSNHIVLC